jgi:hypothetical protein
MRNALLLVVLAFSMTSCQTSRGIPFSQALPDLQKEAATFNFQDPAADVQKNLSNGDKRFLLVCGYACFAPGQLPANSISELNSRIIQGTMDAIQGEEHRLLIEKVTKYAEQYNSALLLVGLNKPISDDLVVQLLDKPLPSKGNDRQKFLWDTFVNNPDAQGYIAYTADTWKVAFGEFATNLVSKADVQKLDSISLRKSLDLVLKDSKNKFVYLPVGAYQTTLDGNPVWIVVVKWERVSTGKKSDSIPLAHIRAFVFDQMTLEKVGFMTCD